MLNGAVPASNPAAPAPAAKLRRVTPARADFVGDLRVIELLPGYGDQPSRALFLLLFIVTCNGPLARIQDIGHHCCRHNSRIAQI
jgi:hypothetical protein